jgi:hypothetical protein
MPGSRVMPWSASPTAGGAVFFNDTFRSRVDVPSREQQSSSLKRSSTLLASSSVFIVRARHSRTAAYRTRWTGNPSRWGESAGVPVVAVRYREPVS